MNIFGKIKRKIKDIFSLSGRGERVDIDTTAQLDFDQLDMYQKSHIKRYEFARNTLNPHDIVGDFACGTGYGSSMLSERSAEVIGVDINEKVVETIKKRYAENNKVTFITSNILDLHFEDRFDKIISFETVEHIDEQDIPRVFTLFSKALKRQGILIFSVPYMQEKSREAIEMGFHRTFYIDENKIREWLALSGFGLRYFKYQNYKTHDLADTLAEKDFIICEAQKIR